MGATMADKVKAEDVAAHPAEGHDPMEARDAAGIIDGILGDDLDAFERGREATETEEPEGDSPEEGEDPGGESEDYEDFEEEFEEFEEDDPDAHEVEDDEVEDSDETSDSEPIQTVTVQVDGEEKEVPLDEAIAGYQRQAASTRRFQEAAELRKEAEAEMERTRTERSRYVQGLEALEQVYEQMQPEEPDWDALREADPAEYAAARADWQEQQQNLQRLRQERERELEKQRAELQDQQAEIAQREHERLLEALPKWKKDPEVRSKEASEMVTYAESQFGFTRDDLSGVSDHRLLLMLRKAMLYDQMKSEGKKVRKKAKKSPTLKPGGKRRKSKKGKKTKAARERLSQTGRVDDAAAVLVDMIED